MLPPLREELRLLPAATNRDGTPAWIVQDPVNNRFFRIGWIDFELLLRWAASQVLWPFASISKRSPWMRSCGIATP